MVCLCAALCGFGVGIAGIFPRFAYENPAHRASLSALIWGFVGATLYLILSAVLLFGGFFLAQQWAEKRFVILASTLACFLILSVTVAFVPLLGAERRLNAYVWEE